MSSGAIPSFAITADQAAQNVALATRRQRTQRRLPAPAPSIAKFAEENQIYIFNVSPWRFDVMLGSWGTYHVPACEPGQPYACGTPIPGIYHEPIPVNESNFQLESIEGNYVAEQILGIGKNLSGNTSLVRLGVFKSTSKVPTESELESARDEFMGECQRLFDEADLAYAQGAAAFAEVVGKDGSKHKLAARLLGRQDAEWMKNASAGRNVACPNCGTYVAPNVISCPRCAMILNAERYSREIAPNMPGAVAGATAEVKRGPGRPPNPRPE